MQIINKTKGKILAEKAGLANTIFSRSKGLLGRKDFKQGEALIIVPCNSIHTFFMRFAIDVLFVDSENKVIKAISNMRPFRLSNLYFSARYTIELPTGTIKTTSTAPGDILEF